jgi:hypothetical protein
MVYNEKISVDSKFDSVADIGHGKENVRIKSGLFGCGRYLLS